MNISISGVNRLLNKLERINHIKAIEALDSVAEDVKGVIREACPVDSGAARSSIGVSDRRSNNLSAYIDVGLSNKTGPWEQWKGAYFQNYGYHNWGRGGIYHGKYVFIHIMWFNSVTDTIKGSAGAKIKAKLKLMILAAWGG